MQVIPLVVPQVNWAAFTKVCKEYLDTNPLSSLDKANWDTNLPASLAGALHQMSNIDAPIALYDHYLRHVSITLMCIFEDYEISTVFNNTSLDITSEWARSRQVICVASGDIVSWIDTVLANLVKGADNVQILYYNEVYNVLVKMGFKNLFSRYNRVEYKQGFIFEEK